MQQQQMKHMFSGCPCLQGCKSTCLQLHEYVALGGTTINAHMRDLPDVCILLHQPQDLQGAQTDGAA